MNKYNCKDCQKPINQYSKQGKFIKQFEGASIASKELKISRSSIANAVTGRAKTAGGYIWEH